MKIYVDYDSTINDLDSKWCKWIFKHYKDKITSKDILSWTWIEDTYGKGANSFFQNPDIYSKDIIKPLKNSQNFIDTIIDLFGYENIYIITSSYPGTEIEKEYHICRYFPIKSDNIIHSNQKWKHTHDGILIDDNIHTVRDHCKYNKQFGIVFDKGSNNGWSKLTHIMGQVKEIKNYIRIRENYKDILKLLKEI